MRNSKKVLNGLSKHSPQVNYKFERLYRILFNEEMYYVAYQRIYAKEGNMTEGSDGKTIDGMSLTRIADLIDLLRKERYQPKPARHTVSDPNEVAILHSIRFKRLSQEQNGSSRETLRGSSTTSITKY